MKMLEKHSATENHIFNNKPQLIIYYDTFMTYVPVANKMLFLSSDAY